LTSVVLPAAAPVSVAFRTTQISYQVAQTSYSFAVNAG